MLLESRSREKREKGERGERERGKEERGRSGIEGKGKTNTIISNDLSVKGIFIIREMIRSNFIRFSERIGHEARNPSAKILFSNKQTMPLFWFQAVQQWWFCELNNHHL